MHQELEELVRNWDQLAMLPHGRYVHHPAVMDERGGVVSVPLPVFDPQLIAAAVMGLAAVPGTLLLRRWLKDTGPTE